jgi:hypothetical protein
MAGALHQVGGGGRDLPDTEDLEELKQAAEKLEAQK